MNLKEVHRILKETFQKELTEGKKRHVVFWYDEEGEFTEEIDEIELDGVKVWKVTDHNLFATKYELEKKEPHTHFLLYSNRQKPKPREDWLYDIYKLGSEFATDKTTITMRELGITDDALRNTFKGYKQFFNNKARFQAFTKYPMELFTEEAIDLTVLAALCKSATNSIDDIVKTLLIKQLHAENTFLLQIEKFGDKEKFWALMEKYYGYTNTEKTLPSLATFFIVTYLSQQSPAIDFPENWRNHVSSRPANIVVFMDQWMNHREDRKSYNELAVQVAELIEAERFIEHWDVLELSGMDAFPIFDEKIITYLSDQLQEGLGHFEQYNQIISARRKTHWYPEFKQEYEAIYHAGQLIQKIANMDYFIPEQSANQMFHAYAKEYFIIDTAYRKFYAAYDKIESNERLFNLRRRIENIYVNRFVEELAVKWVGSLEKNQEYDWPISGIPQQKDFYRNWVRPYQDNDERIFVIVSDALRYEVANELMGVLNNERKASAELKAIQGVLPSYTGLGMAAILPHKQLRFTGEGAVLIDGTHTSGLDHRNTILQNQTSNALALSFNDLTGMNRTTFRETLYGRKVVYIYHNTIDARGDHAATEKEIFKATEAAIKDIRQLVNRLVVDVSASNILITSDHGFIYQRDALSSSQKLSKSEEDSILTKRRFSVSDERADEQGTLSYPLDYIFEQDKKLYVTVPKGINRFAIQGPGANYVHGGAMLQEIVVPVITFKNDRSKSSLNMAKKVDIKLTTPTRKITNMITYLEFFQTAAIEEKKLPLRLKLYFVNENNERISNENIIIADSTLSQAGERIYREKFVFKSAAYDKRKTYYLVLKEDESERLYERYPFTIDIAYSDGFGY